MVPASRDCQWCLPVQITGRGPVTKRRTKLCRDEENDSDEVNYSLILQLQEPVVLPQLAFLLYLVQVKMLPDLSRRWEVWGWDYTGNHKILIIVYCKNSL